MTIPTEPTVPVRARDLSLMRLECTFSATAVNGNRFSFHQSDPDAVVPLSFVSVTEFDTGREIIVGINPAQARSLRQALKAAI